MDCTPCQAARPPRAATFFSTICAADNPPDMAGGAGVGAACATATRDSAAVVTNTCFNIIGVSIMRSICRCRAACSCSYAARRLVLIDEALLGPALLRHRASRKVIHPRPATGELNPDAAATGGPQRHVGQGAGANQGYRTGTGPPDADDAGRVHHGSERVPAGEA